MLIDWFTVGAQIVNFLILMWLLKHFLYQPVLDAIDAREQRIARQVEEAQKTQDAAELERAEFEYNNTHFEEQHAAMLEKARAEAQTARSQLLEEARTEATALRAQWQEALRKEQQNLSASIATRTHQEVFAITRKALTELADSGLETRIVAVFIQRLQALGEAEKAPLSTPDGAVLIRSAFPLPEAEQATLTKAVQTALSITAPLQFEVQAELVSGIELISGGHKLGWSIAEYLGGLEESITGLLDSKVEEKTDDS